MTADQLTEKLGELRRRMRADLEQAKAKDLHACSVAEEAKAAGLRLLYDPSEDGWQREAKTSALNAGVDLVREFLGLEKGADY